jgi:hypothetical protein
MMAGAVGLVPNAQLPLSGLPEVGIENARCAPEPRKQGQPLHRESKSSDSTPEIQAASGPAAIYSAVVHDHTAPRACYRGVG